MPDAKRRSRAAAKARAARTCCGVSAGNSSAELWLAHPAGEILQDVIDRDPGALETGLPAAYIGPDLDVVFEAHGNTIGSPPAPGKS